MVQKQVSFIQMLKAFTPVAILLISFAFRLQEPNKKLACIIALISGGCALAAYGELNFELFGFICQVLAVLVRTPSLPPPTPLPPSGRATSLTSLDAFQQHY